MAYITVRFILGEGIVSSLIAWLTGSLFSHVEFGTPKGTWIGARWDGVEEKPAGYCTPRREYVYEIPCVPEQAEALLVWAREKIGMKYNYMDILGVLLHNRALHSPSRFICSQFCLDGLTNIFTAYKTLNVALGWTYRITPEELHLSPIFVGNLKRKKG